jgi:hypothetical protein
MLLLAATLTAFPARAESLRIRATDPNGITLQLVIEAWRLSSPDPRGYVRVLGVTGAHELATPGRPQLPAWSATILVPPGSWPSARVVESEGQFARDGVSVAIAGRPVFHTDEVSGQEFPAVEEVPLVTDFAAEPVSLTEPFGFRGWRLVQLEVRPFEYQAATRRLSSPLSLTVRVDFHAPQGSPGPGGASLTSVSDPVLQSVVLNREQAPAWRVAPHAHLGRVRSGDAGARLPGGAAFDDTDPEVRVKLGETGLYRLDADRLLANGFPAGTPVGEVSVHRHEFVEAGDPPYVTLEYPIEVEDQDGDGRFGSGDGVWLWARSWAERTQATTYRRWWGDAEVVYVTRKPSGGRRIPHRAAWRDVPGLVPIRSYPWTEHHEFDGAPMLAKVGSTADTNLGVWHWTDLSYYYNRPDTMRLRIRDLDTTRQGQLTVRWVGRRDEPHFLWAGLGDASGRITVVIDSVSGFGRTALTRTGTFPGSALSDGDASSFREWGKNGEGPPDRLGNFFTITGLDWFDLTYWRGFRTDRDLVRFNTGDAEGDVQIHVEGFGSDSVRVYDVTDDEQPTRIVLDLAHQTVGATLAFDFQDHVVARRSYVAASQLVEPRADQGPLRPVPDSYCRVTRRHLAAATSGDYLLVYPEAFASAIEPLAELRRSQGYSVIEAPIESIDDEFGDGRHTAHSLQRFVRWAYEHWDTHFLLLAGNGTLDPMNVRITSARDWIPVIPTPAPVATAQGIEIIPSDNRYGYLVGNDDPISSPDTNRVVPEIMVGRLPANNLTDLSAMITKIVAYEQHEEPEDWRRRVLLTADDAYSGESQFAGEQQRGYCHHLGEETFPGLDRTMRGMIVSDSGVAGMQVENFDLRSYIPDGPITFDPVTGDTCRPSRDDTRGVVHAAVTPILLGRLNAGQLLWSYHGHGNEYLLTHEDLFIGGNPDDASRLQNDGRPFLFTAYSCHVNMFARPESELRNYPGPCIGADLLALPNGRGAVASWASVGYEALPRNDWDHVGVELVRSMFVNPPRDESLGPDVRGARVVLGEAILASLFRYVGTTQSYESERGQATSYTLLGDPATRVSIGRPSTTVTVNGMPVSSPMRLHTPGNALRIEAELVSNIRLDSLELLRDLGAGEVEIPDSDYHVTPAFPDTGVSSAFGGRRFALTYETTIEPRNADYTLFVRDRNGLVQRSVVSLRLEGVLRSSGGPLLEDDAVAPAATLSMLLLSPKAIANPLEELQLQVNGHPQVFTASAVPTDLTETGVHSGREWVLSWTHADYPIDNYVVTVLLQGGASVTRRFRVTEASGQLGLRDLFPFPNPFDASGTNFSFMLLGGVGAEVKVNVFTQSGRLIYTRVEHDLAPGYHQLAWNGRDSEGDDIANGVYFFRITATTASGASTRQLGRLVKLRAPRHTD